MRVEESMEKANHSLALDEIFFALNRSVDSGWISETTANDAYRDAAKVIVFAAYADKFCDSCGEFLDKCIC
jgi:hypothetical protein